MTHLKTFAIAFLLLIAILGNSQVVLNDTILKYLPATSEPHSEWRNLDFDDSNWQNTSLGDFSMNWHSITVADFPIIGYGDSNNVKIPKVQTFYTRSIVRLNNPSDYEELMMVIDFDDSFVAYINGVEFARANLGKNGSTTTYDQLADRSHDLRAIQGSNQIDVLNGYYIDKDFIDNHLIEGENVLSIEYHNDSINGTDLGFWGGVVIDITNADFNVFNLPSRYKRCMELDSTHLPIIVIESDEFGIPKKRIEVFATIGIINNGKGNYNKPSNSYNAHFGDVKIELRGQSSADYPKKSYDFELKDPDGKDTSISLLGLPREADWILQGPWADRSQFRNALIYELGRKTGNWSPKVKFCEVIINGEYVGLYNLIEKIKRDSNRVNVAKLRDEEISGTDVSGGYILKYDKPNNSTFQIVYPKDKNIQDEQETYIRDFIAEYEEVLYSNEGLDEVEGYNKYIDTESLIDYMIISELGKNCDAYRFSTFFHKDKDDRDPRLKYGPLWDFDLCFGNSIWQDGFKTDGWQFAYPGSNVFHILRLFQDPLLVDSFKYRWFELRESFLSTDSLFAQIDELAQELEQPLKRNYEVWPVVDKGLFFPYYTVPNYDEEIVYIKNWISDRVVWIDDNIDDIYYDVTDIEDIQEFNSFQFKANLYPNPMVNEFIIDSYVDKGNYKVYYNKGNEDLKRGLHIVNLKLDGKSYYQMKVMVDN
jgi:hypothetical protein